MIFRPVVRCELTRGTGFSCSILYLRCRYSVLHAVPGPDKCAAISCRRHLVCPPTALLIEAQVSLHFPSRETRAPTTMACSPLLSSSLARTALGRSAPHRRVTAPHHRLHRYVVQRTFSMSPSVQDRNAEGSSKPVVLLMDEIKLADDMLRDLSQKWDVVVSTLSRGCCQFQARKAGCSPIPCLPLSHPEPSIRP